MAPLRSCFFGVAEVCSWDLVLEKYSDPMIFQMVKNDMAASDFPETIDIGLSTMNCYSKHHSLRGVGLEMIGIYSYFFIFPQLPSSNDAGMANFPGEVRQVLWGASLTSPQRLG